MAEEPKSTMETRVTVLEQKLYNHLKVTETHMKTVESQVEQIFMLLRDSQKLMTVCKDSIIDQVKSEYYDKAEMELLLLKTKQEMHDELSGAARSLREANQVMALKVNKIINYGSAIAFIVTAVLIILQVLGGIKGLIG